MNMSWNRNLSGMVGIAYIAAAYFLGNAEMAFKTMGFIILPLACIWFSESMGGYTGPTTSMPITQASPGWAVCIVGWLVLLMPIVIIILEKLS